MGTSTAVMIENTQIVSLPNKAELVGPGTPFDKRRMELRAEVNPILDASSKITIIKSHEDAEEVARFGRLLQVSTKESEAFFKGIKVKIDAIKKPVLDAEREDTERIDREKSRLGGLQTAWNAQVRREKEEADRIAREAAEAAAREDVLARAVEMEEAGELQAAEHMLDEPIIAAPVVTQFQSTPKTAGSVSKVNYSATVENLKELVKAVAEGRAPIQAILANESFINQQARSFREGFSMPGCKLKRDESTHYRG